MKIDIYTKIVLTVIASALVVMVAQNSVGQANANLDIQKVAICSLKTNYCADVGEISDGNNKGTKVLLVVDVKS